MQDYNTMNQMVEYYINTSSTGPNDGACKLVEGMQPY